MGYVEETGAAQHWRDSRIAPIYEGTNGIQAIDLVLRKLPMDGGAVVHAYLDEMAALDAALAAAGEDLDGDPHQPRRGCRAAAATPPSGCSPTTTPTTRSPAPRPYLRLFGTVAGGYYMARQALVAQRHSGDGDDGFLAAKMATARFYCEQLLPQAFGLVPAVTAHAEVAVCHRAQTARSVKKYLDIFLGGSPWRAAAVATRSRQTAASATEVPARLRQTLSDGRRQPAGRRHRDRRAKSPRSALADGMDRAHRRHGPDEGARNDHARRGPLVLRTARRVPGSDRRRLDLRSRCRSCRARNPDHRAHLGAAEGDGRDFVGAQLENIVNSSSSSLGLATRNLDRRGAVVGVGRHQGAHHRHQLRLRPAGDAVVPRLRMSALVVTFGIIVFGIGCGRRRRRSCRRSSTPSGLERAAANLISCARWPVVLLVVILGLGALYKLGTQPAMAHDPVDQRRCGRRRRHLDAGDARSVGVRQQLRGSLGETYGTSRRAHRADAVVLRLGLDRAGRSRGELRAGAPSFTADRIRSETADSGSKQR